MIFQVCIYGFLLQPGKFLFESLLPNRVLPLILITKKLSLPSPVKFGQPLRLGCYPV